MEGFKEEKWSQVTKKQVKQVTWKATVFIELTEFSDGVFIILYPNTVKEKICV